MKKVIKMKHNSEFDEKFAALIEEARALASQLLTDIKQASTRIEHIRLTARANEAAHIVKKLENWLEKPSKTSEISENSTNFEENS